MGLLDVADAIEMHSGGFHLRFESERGWPVFACPRPLRPEDGPAVRLALRWKTRVDPGVALRELAGGFDAMELVFLDRLRSVIVGTERFSLEPVQGTGPFATYRDQLGRSFHRLGDPETGAVAVVTQPDDSGRDVLEPMDASVHAYFRISKCPTRLGVLVHAPEATSGADPLQQIFGAVMPTKSEATPLRSVGAPATQMLVFGLLPPTGSLLRLGSADKVPNCVMKINGSVGCRDHSQPSMVIY